MLVNLVTPVRTSVPNASKNKVPRRLLFRPTSARPCNPAAATRMFALSHSPRTPAQKTFAQQASLPRLPVPTLQASLERYLVSLRPIIADRAARGELPSGATVESELAQRKAWAEELLKEGGMGGVLQERLKDVDRSMPDNWLDDAFWIKVAYHSWRVPLPINSNWWILMAHDPDIPTSVTDAIPEDGTFTGWQIRRAARLAWRFLDFKDRLERQDIVPDSSRAARWLRPVLLSSVFGVTRIPSLPTDHLLNTPHPSPSRTISVLVRDQVYLLPVISADGKVLPVEEIEAGLWGICEDVVKTPKGQLQPPVGNLTAASRDDWTRAREHLLTLSPSNRVALNGIEESLFTVSLDDSTRPPSPDELPASSTGNLPSKGLDSHIVTASANVDGRNRWFDKSFQVIVENNSRSSLNGEHSPCDALIPSIVSDYAQAEGVGKGEPDASLRDKGARGELGGGWEKVQWVTDGKVLEDIQKAKATAAEVQKDSDGKMLWFDDYGADWIKKSGKQSPDAYIQMAMQLAWYRQMGWATPTYETASTRLFRKGRTDVIRTLSEDSYKFVKAMDDPSVDDATRFALLSAATAAHNKFTRDASLGKGCDRHLMGLTLVHRPEDDGPLPAALSDPLFRESQTWNLSTSGLSAGDRFFGTGFGAPFPGYGVNYLAGGKVIKFGIESKHSDPKVSTDKFREFVTEAMRDMRTVCEKGQGQASAGVGGATESKL